MRSAVALVSGALFGLGLIVSDMVNPARVLGFLDFGAIPEGIGAGGWDPTLAFVMAGALLPMALAWRLAAARAAPVCGGSFPGRPSGIDSRLMTGAAIFGLGWGMVGFCPGPALTALGTGQSEAIVFTAAMVAGMYAHRLAGPARQAA